MERRRNTRNAIEDKNEINKPLLCFDRNEIFESDLKCLDYGQFLNDKIINFYLKFMHKTLLNDQQAGRVHIFDSFFMEVLRTNNAERIARWERRTDIFRANYVLVPVELNMHWFLIIVCHPDKIKNNNSIGLEKTQLLIMDSMGTYSGKKAKSDIAALKE